MRAIVLCAGRSSRFGGKNKALASLGDETVIERIVRHIDPFVDESIVTVSSENVTAMRNALEGKERLRIVVDDSFAGPLASAMSSIATSNDASDFLVILGEVIYRTSRLVATIAKRAPSIHCDFLVPVEMQAEPYFNILVDAAGEPFDVHCSLRTGTRMPSGLAILGHYLLRAGALPFLSSIQPYEGELYMTDVVAAVRRGGGCVRVLQVRDAGVLGFNTIEEFRSVRNILDAHSPDENLGSRARCRD